MEHCSLLSKKIQMFKLYLVHLRIGVIELAYCHLLIGYEICLTCGRAMKAKSPTDLASGQKESFQNLLKTKMLQCKHRAFASPRDYEMSPKSTKCHWIP